MQKRVRPPRRRLRRPPTGHATKPRRGVLPVHHIREREEAIPRHGNSLRQCRAALLRTSIPTLAYLMTTHPQWRRLPARRAGIRVTAGRPGRGSGNKRTPDQLRKARVPPLECLGRGHGGKTPSSIRTRRKMRIRRQPRTRRKGSSTPCWRRSDKASLTTGLVGGDGLWKDCDHLSCIYSGLWTPSNIKFGLTTQLDLSSHPPTCYTVISSLPSRVFTSSCGESRLPRPRTTSSLLGGPCAPTGGETAVFRCSHS